MARALRSLPLERVACAGAALCAVGAFVAAALVRRLNFDESLALRAGWLEWARIPGEPAFVMPQTLALGALGHALADPGAVFAVARLVTAGAVLAAGAFALARARVTLGLGAMAALLCFAQAAFGVHGYEFRYDAALLVAWLAGFGLLVRRAPRDFAWLGVCVAWLFAHHLKGAFFAVGLYALCWVPVILEGERRARLVALHAGLAGTAVAWVGLCAALDLLDPLAATYRTFASLAADDGKVWPWTALGRDLARDTVWWTAAAAALCASALPLARRLVSAAQPARELRGALDAPDTWALAFALLALAFPFVHPHPWPYMLALPAPFLAFLIARRGADALARAPRQGKPLAALALAAALALHASLGGAPPFGAYLAALASPGREELDSLRLLRAVAAPGERVLDPSGLAYFLPPCTSEWYLDTLFASRAERGAWMRDLSARNATDCPWALHTYRLRMIPAAQRARLAREYEPASGGLLRARSDGMRTTRAGWQQLELYELRSFWW